MTVELTKVSKCTQHRSII